jgi:K+-transporting ATPase ATPase A chain
MAGGILMNVNGLTQIALYIALLVALGWPLGWYMARVYAGRYPAGVRFVEPLERLIYRFLRVRPDEEMNWKGYAVAMLLFNLLGFAAVYLIQRLQQYLPLNPQGFGPVSPDSALNTAASFATNTNWQGYGGESTMSYFTQMAALTVQNFVSAASGMAVLLPLIRGFVRRTTSNVGNFWVDLTRGTLYILLPCSLLLALALVSQGVIQNFASYVDVPFAETVTYEKPVLDDTGKPVVNDAGKPKNEIVTVRQQTLPMGPVASQVAIKQLGTNGGGFFNTNSAHPFENPTPLSNILESLAILLIPAALCFTFGRMIGDTRQGWVLFAAMLILLVVFLGGCWWAEQSGNPRLVRLGVDPSAGNMEGKEVRFGVVNSALWATATTAAANGSVNSMHDSFTPLGGLVPMVLMKLGEVVFGGVGSGLYGMLAFVVLTVFIAGLMVGRTPEYLGKKIEPFEMKMAVVMVLLPPALVLLCTALAVLSEAGTASISNPGPHGFSQILYAFASMSNNNGSAFAGLNANVPFYNLLGAFAMLAGRYWLAVPVLAMAGSLAGKKITPVSAGTLPTHTPLFVGMLIAVVLLVGALTFLPVLALGPIVEHFRMIQ